MRRWRIAAESVPPEVAAELAAILAGGGVLAVPTETYYGLAAHFERPAALERVCDLKARAADRPLLLLIATVGAARNLAPGADSALEQLAAEFWPGPLTIVLPAGRALHPAIVSATGGVAVRQSAHPVAAAIARALAAPFTATSANVSGAPPPTSAARISLAAGHVLDGVVDSGTTPGGPASTLLDLSTEPFQVLRQGAVPERALRDLLGSRLQRGDS